MNRKNNKLTPIEAVPDYLPCIGTNYSEIGCFDVRVRPSSLKIISK